MKKKLINIGDVLMKELEQIGIKNLEDLKRTGSAKALFMIHNNSGEGCINMLYALEGAIKGIRWHDLTGEEKEKIKKEYKELVQGDIPA